MATQVTITKKQENKGARGILDLTSTLSQVKNQFMGIYDSVLPDTDGLTVEQWMLAHGVRRYTETKKNGTTKVGDYTPALIMEGFHNNLKFTDCKGTHASIFKEVTAKCSMGDEFGDPDAKMYKVFTKEEAEKLDGKPIKRYLTCEIAPNKWSVSTILKGLTQSKNMDKELEKHMKREEEWKKLEHVYIVVYKQNTETKQYERHIYEVPKSSVVF